MASMKIYSIIFQEPGRKLTTLVLFLAFSEDGCNFYLFPFLVNPPLQDPGLFKGDVKWLRDDIESSSAERKSL